MNPPQDVFRYRTISNQWHGAGDKLDDSQLPGNDNLFSVRTAKSMDVKKFKSRSSCFS